MLRRGTLEDAAAMAAIYTEDLQETYRGILPEDYLAGLTAADAESTWRQYLAKPDRYCLVWEEQGRVAGFAGVCPDNGDARTVQLSALYVHRDFQGAGIGRRLVSSVLREEQGRGNRVAISVVLQNLRAKGLYEKLGARFQNTFFYSFGCHPLECGRYLWELPETGVKQEYRESAGDGIVQGQAEFPG